MDENLSKVDSFIASAHCLFKLDALDYPSFFHQKLIKSYINLRSILSKPHGQIIRQLHSVSDKGLEQLAQGFLYCCLLDKSLMESVMEYLAVLRVEVWYLLTRNFQIILAECLESIRPECKSNIGLLLTQIFSYNVCSPELIQFSTKSISNYDFDELNIAASTGIFQTFIKFLKESQGSIPSELKRPFAHYVFLKASRLLSTSYQSYCIQLISLIWDQLEQQCEFILLEVSQHLPFFVSGQNNSQINKIWQKIKTKLETREDPIISSDLDLYKQRVLGVTMDRKTELALNYLIREGLTPTEIKYQTIWMEKQWQNSKKNQLSKMVDISRWIVTGADFHQVRLGILEWLVRRASSMGHQCYQKIRFIIFSQFFCKNVKLSSLITSLMFLRKMLYTDTRIASDFLVYILQNKGEHEQNIRKIFKEAEAHNYFQVQQVFKSNYIAEGVKKQISNLLSGYQPDNLQGGLEFNPDSTNSKFQQINYDAESEPINTIKVHPQIKSSTHHIILEAEFVGLFDSELTNLLDEPKHDNFVIFYSKVCEEGIQIRKNKEKKYFFDILCQEAARVIFAIFNREFEDFKDVEPYQTSVIYHMLSTVSQDWDRVTHKLQTMKGIIKKIKELFPIAEVAFWKCFFTYFEFGGVNHRHVKKWLVPNQKTNLVLKAIEAFTEQEDNDLRRKAAAYGIK